MLIAGVVCLLVASPFVWLAMSVFARDRAIARWPRVEALVTSSGATTSTRRNTDPNADPNAYFTWYTPNVRYSYSVEGRTYEGTSVARSLDGVGMDQSGSDRILKRYPLGAKVSAYYNPAAPQIAHLEVTRSVGAIILLGMGLLIATIGLLLAGLSFA